MKQELEDKLCRDFPEYFAGKDEPITQNLMSFGCECNDGWFQLIYDCCKELKSINAPIKWMQIKEKYGTIRLYFNFTEDVSIDFSNQINDIIDKYDELSSKICEDCGSTKDIITKSRFGWVSTLCKNCEDEMIVKRKVLVLCSQLQTYANSNGYKLTDDKEYLDKILRAMLKKSKNETQFYCPCRIGKIDDNICPCVFHKKEIEENGSCHCEVFFKKD